METGGLSESKIFLERYKIVKQTLYFICIKKKQLYTAYSEFSWFIQVIFDP